VSMSSYVVHMPSMIEIRHVADPLHRKLKARAAQEGKSLSDYLLREIQRIAERPTLEELRERLARLPPVNPRVPPAQIIREERDTRLRRPRD
jgi:plasmid stability protein